MKNMILLLSILLSVLTACVTNKVQAPTPPAISPAVSSFTMDWENGHPERKSWTQANLANVEANFSAFDGVSDTSKYCPNYINITHDQKVQVWATMVEWVAYFECSWDPSEADVDVGSDNDQNSWSVGLLQMSVVDQESYGLSLGLNFNDLKNPIKNMSLAFPIMKQLITQDGVISYGGTKEFSQGRAKGLARYWSTLWTSANSYASIVSHVKSLPFCGK